MRSHEIVSPANDPDLDGVACAVGYAELLDATGRHAFPWYTGTMDAEALFHLRRSPDIRFASHEEAANALAWILVDANDPQVLPASLGAERVIEVIDHRFHGSPAQKFLRATICIEKVGAAATLIVERFREHNLAPSKGTAEMLYGAIHSNTQRLRGSITEERDRSASKWLEQVCGVNQAFLEDQFADRKAAIIDNLAAALLQERRTFKHLTGEYAVTQLEFRDAISYFEKNESIFRNALLSMAPRTLLNVVDLNDGASLMYVLDSSLLLLLSQRLNLAFENHVGRVRPGLLRKQIVAAIEA